MLTRLLIFKLQIMKDLKEGLKDEQMFNETKS